MTLDLSKQFVATQTVYLGLGDRNGTTIIATISDNGIPADISGMDATLCARTMDGTIAFPCTVSGNVVTCHLDERRFASSAEMAYISLSDGQQVYSTERFRIVALDGNTR
jgi:hypothetical protein